jgi:hypothetical protein
MLMKHKAFSLLYVLLSLWLLFFAAAPQVINYQVARPMVVIFISLYFIYCTRLKGRFHKRLFVGFIFAGIADVLLVINQPLGRTSTYAFVAYALAALFYIRAYYLDFRSAQELDKKGARIGILLCTVTAMGFYIFLRPYVTVSIFPVMLATFLLSMLLMMAIFRNLRVNQTSFRSMLAGACLLVLSTMAYALSHFVFPFAFAEQVILGTYLFGQYLVLIGGMERKLLVQEST